MGDAVTELNTEKLKRARDVLQSKDIPEPYYLVSGDWSYKMGDVGTEFSEDQGKTWHEWDDIHPACIHFRGLLNMNILEVAGC